ncbi:preprotein translocase subunit SecY [Lachnospiraceae bacterium 29-84]
MLETFRNAFKIKDIRNRIFYTLVMLVIIRIGSQLPLPGVNSEVIANWFASQGTDALNFFDAITGGSFEEMSVFALNITPYITSSIIMQLLTIAIPKLEEMQKDGEDGRKKIAEITRYVTVALALIQSIAMAIGFGRGGYLDKFDALHVIMMVTGLTAGSAVLMWIGERITEHGVGNGISIVLTINIISRIPEDLMTLYTQFIKNAPNVGNAIIAAAVILAVILVTVVFVIILQDGQRKIPVQYSKKVQGRKQVGGQSSHIPLKVNTAGVIPIIFAQSIMQFPVVIATILGKGNGTGIGSQILHGLSQSYWCNPQQPIYSIGLLVYIILVVAFAYFYTSITFNPLEIANNMKRQGGFIPGIRPGKPTSDYLNKILNYIVFIGAVGLMIVAVIPIFFNGVFSANVSFGGTSIIIIVGVIIETLKQIESQMLVRYYKGFLND